MNPSSSRLQALAFGTLLLLASPARAAEIPAAFNSASTIPVSAASYTATGNTVKLELNFAPVTGTSLMVVRNTGNDSIQGAFDNLSQGQRVDLSYGGIIYPFVANYYGGTGNDLVLQWGNTRVLQWDYNGFREMTGVLAGKTVIALDAGDNHTMALCSDGTVAAWGVRFYQMSNVASNIFAPVPVDTSGVLAGKRVIAISAGSERCLVLCSDGTLAAWGDSGSLGNNSYASSKVPVLVDQTGVLAGKRVVEISAGTAICLVRCSDGTLASWGNNISGSLGIGDPYSSTESRRPVLVYRGGVLASKNVTAISCGHNHALVLCSDGTLAAWGSNWRGALGDGTTTDRSTPVLVNRSGVLSSRTVREISCGSAFNLALCADGSVAAWGHNGNGELGNNTTLTRSLLPVLVNRNTALFGKTVAHVAAGPESSYAVTSDGMAAAWGRNNSSQLGNGSTSNSLVPVPVSTEFMAPQERFLHISGGGGFGVGLTALPPWAFATTQAAVDLKDTAATLRGIVNANGSETTISFEYGQASSSETSVAGSPSSTNGETSASVDLSGLKSGTTYRYRVVATSAGGVSRGQEMTFTTSNLASLADLSPSHGSLNPVFDGNSTEYCATVPFTVSSLRLTPVVASPGATVTVNGMAVDSGAASPPLELAVGNNRIEIVVTAAGDVSNAKTYTLNITRLPEVLTLEAPGLAPLVVDRFVASGLPVHIALGHAPATGASLTLVENMGTSPIDGTFSNLAQGQELILVHNNARYRFVANYHGGSGNDLVLQWAGSHAYAWGSNNYSQLGAGDSTRYTPSMVGGNQVLSGKTITAVAGGFSHSLALCSDGTLAAWGENGSGQIGNGGGPDTLYITKVPVLVDRSGVLAGKTIIAIAAGKSHSLALCSDGTLAAWGKNGNGQLGINSTKDSYLPALVDTGGALAGKTITAIAAGGSHSLVLCSDGSMFSWGNNVDGGLGIGSYGSSSSFFMPVPVVQTGALSGKRVTAIAAGDDHSLALCADGTIVAWGGNSLGQLGNGKNIISPLPVAVNTTGVLSGKTVTAITAGRYGSLALCADGTLAAWGDNQYGQLGNGSNANSAFPVAVKRSGILAGKTVIAIWAGAMHNLALCADGTLAAWGNNEGRLGNGEYVPYNVPVKVSTESLAAGQRFIALPAPSNAYFHSMAIVADPLSGNSALAGLELDSGTLSPAFSPTVTRYTARVPHGTTALAVTPFVSEDHAIVTVNGSEVASGTTSPLISLSPGSNIIDVTVSAQDGVSSTSYQLTVTNDPSLSSLGLSDGSLMPGFSPLQNDYSVCVDSSLAAITVSPVAADPTAVIQVNGSDVDPRQPAVPVALVQGKNTIRVTVRAMDGTSEQYTITLLRPPPLVHAFDSADSVALEFPGYVATGNTANLSLAFAPATGTSLTVLNNTGLDFITGRFANLEQGQRVTLDFNGVSYPFVVNYHGGTGNDLVLEWAYTRAFAWGMDAARFHAFAGSTGRSFLPVPTRFDEVIPGKTLVSIAVGEVHALSLCADGTLVSTGWDSYGQLGAERLSTWSYGPAIVTNSGALQGKTVVQIAAGSHHSMALCSDGTLAAWGFNQRGQVGSGDPIVNNPNRPKAIHALGALAGKHVVSIAAGAAFSLALCSDGTLAAWGDNTYGQLANDITGYSNIPVAVTPRGALLRKKAVAVAAGSEHALVLCVDGTLLTWGRNNEDQLGNNGTYNSNVPVAVIRNGALAGKTIKSIACGMVHNVVLCSDGTVTTWGGNSDGQLGDSSYTTRSAPVPINQSGALSERTVTAVGAMGMASMAACSDGSLVAWGYNDDGQVGDGSSTYNGKNTPTLVNATNLAKDERFLRPGFGSVTTCSVALTALPLADDARLSGLEISPGFIDTEFSPETASYTASIPAGAHSIRVTPRLADPNAKVTVNGLPVVDGSPSPPISLPLADHTIRIRVTAENGSDTRDYSIVLHDDATLSDLRLSTGMIIPEFMPRAATQHGYVAPDVSSVAIIPNAASAGAAITVNGLPVASGVASQPWPLAHGDNLFSVEVITQDGTRMAYQLTITRQTQLDFTYTSASDVPLSAVSYTAFENRVNLSLGFAPAVGTEFTVIRNTGGGWINGQFSNLAHGQLVVLSHNNANYAFVANYHGGSGNDLVLQWADNRIYTWGSNFSTGSTPTPVIMTGVLSGKTIAAAVAGSNHRLVLCSDGTLASWGNNSYGQLGNGTTISSNVPVPVTMSGVLEGKKVVAIAVGEDHNLALCSDGTLVAWGRNLQGQLGDGSTTARLVPVIVSDSGVLAGRKVVAISAGGSTYGFFSVALCSDGTLASWGGNLYGQLGLGTSVTINQSSVPVAVDSTGALAGKTVSAIAAGGTHTLALCSDGTLISWGHNNSGQLGSTVSAARGVPVLVNASGVLSGKTIKAISAGVEHSLALCTDGTLASWGTNIDGQLGNNGTSNSNVPVAVLRSGFLAEKTITSIAAGRLHTLACCSDGTLAAWGYNYYGQLGDGTTTRSRIPIPVAMSSLALGEAFAFPAPAASALNSMALVGRPLSNNSALRSLALSSGTISPEFAVGTAKYISTVPFSVNALSVIAQTAHPLASVRVNGMPVSPGASSSPINLLVGENTITVQAIAQDGITTQTYTITVTRLPRELRFDSGADVPVTANGFSAGGIHTDLVLGYAPAPGSSLTLVNNTGLGFIFGEFSNLTHGQRVWLMHDGVWYAFVANYFGGTGNDLVLQWAGTRVAAWGLNNYGQLGDGGNTQRLRPIAVDDSGVLADKTIFAVSTGYLHSVALCSDGTLASWGYNTQGQLGDNGSAHQGVPVAVDRSGVLADKVVVAISSGSYHNLALCSDGTIAAWGYNNHGQLGTGTKDTARAPVLVKMDGVLAGKQVVAVETGAYQSYALCSDGTLAAWGYNDEGELGNGGNTGSLVPVAVDVSGALAGRKVAAIDAGQYHALALCTDGTVASWGYNQRGQLGNSSTANSATPVAIGSFGALAGKTVTALAAGASHSLALCGDGTLAAWGFNSQSQLGVAGISQSTTPVGVTLPGRPLAAMTAGAHHNLLRFTDGGMAAWGANASGQLGSNNTQAGATAVGVDTSALDHGGFIMFAASGCASSHNLAVFAVQVGEPTDLEIWRIGNFGVAAASRTTDSADCADCDHDGIPNLVEYAFGLDPNAQSAGKLPQPRRNGDRFEMRFSRTQGAADIEYGAEWSPDLQPGSWQDVPDSGNGDERVFSMPVDASPSMFMRLKVKTRPAP